MINPMSLEGRRILLTGASSGIGAACAEVLAGLGASLVLVARREDALERVRAALVGPERHVALACDLSDLKAIAPLVERATAAGKLDGLVHSAGSMPLLPLSVVDEERTRSAFAVNHFAFVELMKCCMRATARQAKFSAVALSSVSAESGWSAGSAYCASKGALSAAVRALAVELAPKGVRVNAVCPSNVKTPLHDLAGSGLTEEEFYRRLSAEQPLGMGEPVQVAYAVAFLLSDAASFVTGVNLPVDGGFLAH